MKSILKYTLLLLGSAALLLSGCKLEQAPEWDEPAVLSAGIEPAEQISVDTKTSYDSEVGKFIWSEGDQIAIHYSNGEYVTGTLEADGTEGYKKVSVTAPEGKSRDFYAVYPATAAVAANYGNPTLQVTFPASYDISDIVSGSSTTRTADFSPCPMVAVNDPAKTELDFYHVGGLLRITIAAAAVPAATQQVRLTFDKDVTGTYTVSNPATTEPTVTTGGSASGNVVTFTLAPAGSSVGSLSANLVLNVPVPCGSYASIRADFLDASGATLATGGFDKALTIARHHGKKLTMKPDLYVLEGNIPASQSVIAAGGTVNLATNFLSYKQDGSAAAKEPFVFQYSANGTSDWTDTPPDWLSPADGIDLSGATTATTLSFTASANTGTAARSIYVRVLQTSSGKTTSACQITQAAYVLGNIPAALTVSHFGGTIPLSTNFRSCQDYGSSATKEPFTFQYSSNGTSGWTDGLPSWLSSSGIDLTGAPAATTPRLVLSPGVTSANATARTTYIRIVQPGSGKATSACRITQDFLTFSVTASKRVIFAHGNLVVIYQSNGNHLWEFESNQWDYSYGTDAGESYAGMSNYQTHGTRISHFGWATAGVKNGSNNYGYDVHHINYQPYSTEKTKNTEVPENQWGYGPSSNSSGWAYIGGANLPYGTVEGNSWNRDGLSTASNIVRKYCDWGVHFNAAGVGSNSTTNGTWYTLSSYEWNYLINNRANRFGFGRIYIENERRYVNGMIILPDNWVLPSGCQFTPGQNARYSTNTYTTGDPTTGYSGKWSDMEAAGAVFLPAAGYRGYVDPFTFYENNSRGAYLSSSAYTGGYSGSGTPPQDYYSGYGAHFLFILAYNDIVPNNIYTYASGYGRWDGRCVRLVHDK